MNCGLVYFCLTKIDTFTISMVLLVSIFSMKNTFSSRKFFIFTLRNSTIKIYLKKKVQKQVAHLGHSLIGLFNKHHQTSSI